MCLKIKAHLFPPFFPIFKNDLSTSNKCHFQTVRARATGLRSYERSFNVVLGSYKFFKLSHRKVVLLGFKGAQRLLR